MNRFLCCVKGESSSNNHGNDDFNDSDVQRLFGDNVQLNNEWRDHISLFPPQDLSPEFRALFRYGPTFGWREIFYGTSNFRREFFLGKGDFGEVFRCNFPRINKVGAVKIQKPSYDAFTEFAAEIKTLHVADHPNVVNLLGKCLDGDHRAIIYEFMPRGSLDRHIYADARPRDGFKMEYAVLDWRRRLDIAIGVANALVYLHEQLKTIHRDLKLANILLDEGFVPKLTDFGLATRIVRDIKGVEKQSNTRIIKGTVGFFAPETEGAALVSSKSDVYSYGVFLLTLFTGMKPYSSRKPEGEKKLTDRMKRKWEREDYIRQVVDIALGNRFSVQGSYRLFQAARMCMHPLVLERPTMRVVETMVREAAAFEVPVPSLTRRQSI